MKKIIIILTSITVLVAGILFLNRDSADIVIITPTSGPQDAWGQTQVNATAIAYSRLEGSNLKYKIIDSGSDNKSAETATTELLNTKGLKLAIGSPESSKSKATYTLFENKSVPLLSSGSTRADLESISDYFFRIMPNDNIQAKIMSNWIAEEKHQRVHVLYTRNAWGVGLKDAFEKQAALAGISLTGEDSFSEETVDFRVAISKLSRMNVDAIFAPLYPESGANLVKQIREANLNIDIYGADVWDTKSFFNLAGKDAKGIKYTTYSVADNAIFDEFKEDYIEQFNETPDNYAAYCHDAFLIGAKAIELSELNDTSVVESLKSIKNFNGATGIITFDGKNSASGANFTRYVVDNDLVSKELE